MLGHELRRPHAPHYCGDDAAAAMGVARYLLGGGPLCITPPTVQVPPCSALAVSEAHSARTTASEVESVIARTQRAGIALQPKLL